MRDHSAYTQEGLQAIIRHIRMYRDMLSDEEARLLNLYEACRLNDWKPIDACGRKTSLTNKRDKDKFYHQLPASTPVYLREAIRNGSMAQLPGYQGWAD